ncbi:MAG: ATPase, T2SS/T4P/T4SS family [bacterium]
MNFVERILLIEDNPLVLRLWKAQLRKMHFEVSTAINGYDGLNKALLEKPALILLDSVMPELDGFDFLMKLRANPALAAIPVIILSNFNFSEDIERARELGAADYLLKYELTPAKLFDTINTVLNLKKEAPSCPPGDPLDQMLLDAAILDPQELQEALKASSAQPLPMIETIATLDFLEPPDKYHFLELAYRTDFVRISDYTVSPEALALIPKKAALEWKIIPISLKSSRLMVAMVDPGDIAALDFVRQLTGKEVRAVYATREDIDKSLILYYGSPDLLNQLRKNLMIETAEDESCRTFSDASKIIQDQAPVVELMDVLIVKALDELASDIHLEPAEEGEIIRLRVDGVLHDVQTLPRSIEPALATRVKIMAGMNISERRLPQDGRFQIRMNEETVDFRVSSIPTIYGEKIVLRLLRHQGALATLEGLGFDDAALAEYRAMVRRPYGMVILTGPTGSGKTTTLYSTLNYLKSRDVNIISIEDPVEYRISGINQIQVHPRIGLTFATALRSILRQDPNIILVGEIRDYETAILAVQAALTGHLVLTTLHTNDAPSAFIRLVDLGVPPFLVASTINGVVAQRLMRCICSDCRREQDLSDEEIARLGAEYTPGIRFQNGAGCTSCHRTGYLGRTAVFEVLPLSKNIRTSIQDRMNADSMRETARIEGMKTLREAAWEKVKAGLSTLEEMWRVTLEEDN